jgi:hypothetical protein
MNFQNSQMDKYKLGELTIFFLFPLSSSKEPVLARPQNRLLAALAPAALHREALNERRGGFLTGRGGPMEELWGAATVAPSFRSVVECEQPGRRASAWDDECGGGVDRRMAHRRAEFGRCGMTP